MLRRAVGRAGMRAELLQHVGALMEGQAPQVLAAGRAGKGENLVYIEPAAHRMRCHITCYGTVDTDQITPGHLLSANEAFEFHDVSLAGGCQKGLCPRLFSTCRDSLGRRHRLRHKISRAIDNQSSHQIGIGGAGHGARALEPEVMPVDHAEQ